MVKRLSIATIFKGAKCFVQRVIDVDESETYYQPFLINPYKPLTFPTASFALIIKAVFPRNIFLVTFSPK